MKYPHYKIMDLRPGELINGRWACIPFMEYDIGDNVVWLQDGEGHVKAFETIALRKPFPVNAIIESDGVQFKAAVRNGFVYLLDTRCEWLQHHW